MDVAIGLVASYLTCLAYQLDLFDASLRLSLPFVIAPIAAFIGLRMAGSYRFAYDENISTHVGRTVWGAGVALTLVFFAAEALGLHKPHSILLLHASSVVLLVLTGLHIGYALTTRVLTRAGALSDRVIIVGATQTAEDIIRRNADIREMNIVGVFDDRLDRAPDHICGAPVIGTVDSLMSWDELPSIDRIIVTVTSTAHARVRGLIDRLRSLPQEVILVLDLEGFAPETTFVDRIVDAPAAYVSGAPKDVRRAAVKRMTDIVLGAMILAGFTPLMALIAILIKLDSKGPVFFRQERHGFNNQIIRVWKFRSMRATDCVGSGAFRQTEANDPRITRIGRVLRSTSLDELPQLINIIRGEMSLVGPRPHAVGMTAEEIEVHRIIGDYAHRHRMKPGLTGWAQINGSRGPVHTHEDVRERVRLDMEYLDKASFLLDLYIILRTAPYLLGDRRNDR